MPIRSLLLSLGLLAACAPSAQAANTKPRPTFTLAPPSAHWKPLHSVDPCNGKGSFRSKYYKYGSPDRYGNLPNDGIGKGGGGAGGSGGGRNAPFEKYAQEGAPNSDPLQAKYTDEYVQKLEAEAGKINGKPDWVRQAEGKTVGSRDDVTLKKAGDYRSQSNALQDTRDAANATLAEKNSRKGGGAVATVYGSRLPNVPVETAAPAAGPPTTFSPGDQYVIVPREE